MNKTKLSTFLEHVSAKTAFFIRVAKQHLAVARGFTLTEVLATVIIIGLVSGGLATAVSVGSRQFMRSMALSESQQLFSSLRQDMDNDLRYSSKYLKGSNADTIAGYISPHHGDDKNPLYIRALDDDGNITRAGDCTTGVGQLALCSDNEKVKNRLLGKGSYNYDLRARIKTFTYDSANSVYTIELEIVQTSLNETLVDETFTVMPLNKVTPFG